VSKAPSRCAWPGTDALYVAYHDEEWGVPEWDERALYEKLVLDGFQAGLSWITILRKREAFRKAFAGFEPERVARFSARDVARLLKNDGIVRHRGKIEGAIKNAKSYLAMKERGESFAEFLWSHVGGAMRINRFRRLSDVPAETDESRALSKALKAHGFVFCGPTVVYAFMQAVGMVNDHMVSCFRHAECAALAGKR
jgi:DNA-3-methyladenine glycosylase I